MVAEGVKSAGPLVGAGAGPRGRDAHRRAGPRDRGRSLLTGRRAHEPHAPTVPTRVGRGVASGAVRMSGLFHGYDVLSGRGRRGATRGRAGPRQGDPPHARRDGGRDRPGGGRRRDRPLRGRPHARSRPAAATPAVEVSELTGVEPGQARALLACARLPRRRRRRAGVHRSRPRGRPALPGPAGAAARPTPRRPCRWPASSARRWRGSPRPSSCRATMAQRGGRPDPVRRGLRQRRRRDHPRHGEAARVRLAAPGGRRDPAQHDVAQPRAGAGAEPGAGGGIRRHGRLHPAQPAPEPRGAGRRWCDASRRSPTTS